MKNKMTTPLKWIYKVLKKVAEIMGFHFWITKVHKVRIDEPEDEIDYKKNGLAFEDIHPTANYSPWLSDKSFNDTHKITKQYSKVHKYRSYELWQLVEETAKLEGALIEVGCWKGGSGALIGKKAKLEGIKDKVYLCDTFFGVVKSGKRDIAYKGGEHANASKEIVQEVVDKLKLDNIKILSGVFPEETGRLIKDKEFRFCHIDVDVYQSAKDSFEWLWSKLVIGGVVVFDDYGFKGCEGVTLFVNEERKKKDRLVIHNLNGHAILIKIK